MVKISGIILAKNEEKNIKEAVLSLKEFCAEIIVLDSSSSDRTKEIALNNGAKVLETDSGEDFSKKRNFGLEKSSFDWVFFLDADERVSKKLKSEINEQVKNENISVAAFLIKRRDFFWGKEIFYGEVRKAREEGFIRLMKKRSGKWVGKVHEVFSTEEKVKRLDGFIDHYPHGTVHEFLNSINFYSSLRARELFNNGKKASVFELISYPFGKFIYTFFVQKGFLDGVCGFVYSFMMSFHSFLVRAKLIQYYEVD